MPHITRPSRLTRRPPKVRKATIEPADRQFCALSIPALRERARQGLPLFGGPGNHKSPVIPGGGTVPPPRTAPPADDTRFARLIYFVLDFLLTAGPRGETVADVAEVAGCDTATAFEVLARLIAANRVVQVGRRYVHRQHVHAAYCSPK